ncbi:hypothetical protein MKX01_006547 [Papaver californicum]|nr:hypothetical protein MKX01_006547 [Papaver californicum]
MGSLIPETARKVVTSETLRSAAKQSERLHVLPLRLCRAIKKYLREQENPHMKRNVLSLSQSFANIKSDNETLNATNSRALVEDPLRSQDQLGKRWKIKTSYGDSGLKYRDDETLAYVASRMPAVYSACHRIFREGSEGNMASLAGEINSVEPSKAMQRAAQSLTLGMKDLLLIKSYDSIQALNQNIDKSEREHDLVIASYVLGEIPSLQDRITVVRQLWDLTRDVLRCRKSNDASSDALEDLRSSKTGAFVVAPCGHDGACPLENTGTCCHFVQRMQRTSSQRLFQWPLDDTKFGTLKELRAKIPEELESDSDDQSDFGEDEEISNEEDLVSCNSSFPEDAADKDDEEDLVSYNSDVPEDAVDKYEEEKEKEEVEECPADLGTGWGRIIFAPMKRGKQVLMHVCRSVKHDGSEGALEHVIMTRSKNPALHRLANKSFWGDFWPLKWEDKQMALSQQHRAAKSNSLVPPL